MVKTPHTSLNHWGKPTSHMKGTTGARLQAEHEGSAHPRFNHSMNGAEMKFREDGTFFALFPLKE